MTTTTDAVEVLADILRIGVNPSFRNQYEQYASFIVSNMVAKGFTIASSEPVGFEAAIKQLGEPDDMNHWSLDEGNLRWFVGQCKAWSAMSDTELERRATMLVVGIRTGKYNVSEIVELAKKYRGK